MGALCALCVFVAPAIAGETKVEYRPPQLHKRAAGESIVAVWPLDPPVGVAPAGKLYIYKPGAALTRSKEVKIRVGPATTKGELYTVIYSGAELVGEIDSPEPVPAIGKREGRTVWYSTVKLKQPGVK